MTAEIKAFPSAKTEIPTSLVKDKLLRRQVKLFGNILGEILRDHAGQRVFAAVEALRKGHISLRRQDNITKRARLSRLIESLDAETLTHVVRAFSIYFSLVNIAEESYSHIQRRKDEDKTGPRWNGSFEATMRDMQQQGLNRDQLQTLLDRLAYIPVITAHPTESKRRTVMEGLRRIFVTSEKLNDPLTQSEREQVIEQLKRHELHITEVQIPQHIHGEKRRTYGHRQLHAGEVHRERQEPRLLDTLPPMLIIEGQFQGGHVGLRLVHKRQMVNRHNARQHRHTKGTQKTVQRHIVFLKQI